MLAQVLFGSEQLAADIALPLFHIMCSDVLLKVLVLTTTTAHINIITSNKETLKMIKRKNLLENFVTNVANKRTRLILRSHRRILQGFVGAS